jgi:uncharacterized protein (TIGR03083 family)
MNTWDATTFDAKDNLLRVVKAEAAGLFALAGRADAWEAPTACALWQVRDIVGHLIDVTESYFVGFDAARAGTGVDDPLGVRVMQSRLDDGAKSLRMLDQGSSLDRLESDFTKFMGMCEALGPDDWGGLIVTHKYMGPLPAFFYPTFQLMDYGVHSWDIRQGTNLAHGLTGDTGDLLAQFMFILWSATVEVPADTEPYTIGVRVTGHNGGDYRVSVGPDGLTYARGDLDGGSLDELPAVIEFDPGSLVLTAFGRVNGGTIRGDRNLADRFLNSFFRI